MERLDFHHFNEKYVLTLQQSVGTILDFGMCSTRHYMLS